MHLRWKAATAKTESSMPATKPMLLIWESTPKHARGGAEKGNDAADIDVWGIDVWDIET